MYYCGSLAQLVEQLAFNQLVTGSNPVRPTIFKILQMNTLKNSIFKISESFSRESFLGSALFFLVLTSWYILRPVRNEMAVANVNELPYLLAAGAIAMLFVNPIYSWLASRSDLRKTVIYCYSFLISNLIIFLLSWKVFGLEDSVWLGRIFYIWCNIYSFFVRN